MRKEKVLHYLGIEPTSISSREKIISALGGFVGILCVFYTSRLVYALSQIESFIGVTEDDLLRIYQLATGREVKATVE